MYAARIALLVLLGAKPVLAQVPVPEQSPDQPVNFEPAPAAAVRVTEVPSTNCAEHVAPHAIPAGELVTVPEPEPLLLTVSVRGLGPQYFDVSTAMRSGSLT